MQIADHHLFARNKIRMFAPLKCSRSSLKRGIAIGGGAMIHIVVFFLLMCTSLVSLASGHDGPAEDCVIVFENEEMRTKVRDDCNITNQIDEAKIVEHYPVSATIEDFDFDDNCFTNCVYKAEKLMNEDGTMNRDEVQHFFKSNMTSKLFVKLTSIFYACVDVADKIAQNKELNPCKKASLHEFCVVKGIITSHDLQQLDC